MGQQDPNSQQQGGTGTGAPAMPPPGQQPPAPGGQPPAGQGGAPTGGQQDGQTDPNSPDALNERLRRRQAALDDKSAALRAFTDLGVTPEQVQQLLAGQQQPPAGSQVDPERLRADLRREVEAELSTAANRRVLEADLTAVAAGRLSDPTDALRYVDLATIDLGQGGRAHRDDLAEAIGKVLEQRPYLAAVQAPPPPAFPNGADQGPRGGAAPKTVDDQIREAQAAGNVRLALSLINSKLADVPR